MEPLSELKYEPRGWKNSAFKKFIEPYTTIIDLTQAEDEILASMKPKGRYNIKVAEKSEVTTIWKKCTIENIKAFHGLLTETTKRDQFSAN
jgi:lipid II:glycine glycyltransferase (peptidoglycan interpeptide bridge formation enzyme)